MSDRNKEYEKFLKQFEKEHPLSSDNTVQMQDLNSYELSSSHKKTPRRKSRIKIRDLKMRYKLIAILSAVVIIVLAVLAAVKFSAGKSDELIGIWDIDGITMYQFDKNGKGSLNLPGNSYPFSYKIKDKSLSIDFESKSARDVTYTFSLEKEKLFLTGEEKGEKITYELKKAK